MKKLLSIFLSVISITLIAQVPQGVGYQGVATDANGIELVNQAISIRASILSGSATGTVEWEETHATITDTFGLFDLTIGQGASTGNGAQANFADISWGTNTHYLKIEMDVTGGSNYSFMGTNQMMSVPYALYAKNAGIDYDSISNLLSNDSTFITNVGGGIRGDGCDILFPEGINGESITLEVNNSTHYQVPTGKKLYVLNWKNYDPMIEGIRTNTPQGMPLILNEGEHLNGNNGSVSPISTFNGLLIPSSSEVSAITSQVSNTIDYEVPVGKKLYVLNWYSDDPLIDGKKVSAPSGIPFVLHAGEHLSGDVSALSTFNGYLVDENYFAGCGSGASSANNSNSNTSGPNQAIGVGSVTDLDDFDKEYDMFDPLIVGDFDYERFHIHTDPQNNIYIIGQYSTNYNNSIGGISLHYNGQSDETFFIAKYDSTGVFIDVITEITGPQGSANDQYWIYSSEVDNYGNIFVGGRKQISQTGDYHAFIRKYTSSTLAYSGSQLLSSNYGWDNIVHDIVSDGNGGVYVAGSYQYATSFNSTYLPNDNMNSNQGFVLKWDVNASILWANTIGTINTGNFALDDYASSIIVNQTSNGDDILVAGREAIDLNGYQKCRVFIRKYDAVSGQLMSDATSAIMDYWINVGNGIKINSDNNGNVYLYTSHNVTNYDPDYSFNSFPLIPVISNSQILYKMDVNFSVLNAINFGTGGYNASQIITLSNNDVILRSRQNCQYIINNSIYTQDIVQYGNITHLNSNNDFIKFHTMGNSIGSVEALAINNNSNTIYSLYYRVGNFTNNGTTYNSGYYVVKENY